METLRSAAFLLFFGGLFTFLFAGPMTLLLTVLLRQVPREHRQMSVIRLWLMAVPMVHVVWIFFAITSVSTSFQKTFAALGRQGQGDCGYKLGVALVLAIWAMAAVPMVAYLINFEQITPAIVVCGGVVFALFGAYVVRMLSAARSLRP